MQFTLLQWNIDYTEPIERIAAHIKHWQPDVLCLQELTRGWQTSYADTAMYLAQTLGLHYEAAYGLMTVPTGEAAHMGVGILSRFPIAGRQQIAIQTVRPRVARYCVTNAII
jgi:endonuclease/exonuclease/phosphatase family metal-dependent hydrolase